MSDNINDGFLDGVEEAVKTQQDVKRFLGDRFVMLVLPSKISECEVEGDKFMWTITRKYKIVYHKPGLVTRIKFFILDISLWLTEKIRK